MSEDLNVNIIEEVIEINIEGWEYNPGTGGLPVTTAENDVIVGSSTVGTWVKKTLAQFKTILGLGTAAYTNSTAYLPSSTTIPTKTSDLSNDSGFITSASVPDQLSDLSEDSTHRTVTDTEKSTWNGKQNALDSGVNIKTINNQSIVGAGNVTISGGISEDDAFFLALIL